MLTMLTIVSCSLMNILEENISSSKTKTLSMNGCTINQRHSIQLPISISFHFHLLLHIHSSWMRVTQQTEIILLKRMPSSVGLLSSQESEFLTSHTLFIPLWSHPINPLIRTTTWTHTNQMRLQFNCFYISFGFLNPNKNAIVGIIQNIGCTINTVKFSSTKNLC